MFLNRFLKVFSLVFVLTVSGILFLFPSVRTSLVLKTSDLLAIVDKTVSVPFVLVESKANDFKNLSELSPQTKVFSNMEPTMLYYDPEESGVTITIGKDACYYHPDVKNVMWNEEVQPYGYAGVRHLCERLLEV